MSSQVRNYFWVAFGPREFTFATAPVAQEGEFPRASPYGNEGARVRVVFMIHRDIDAVHSVNMQNADLVADGLAAARFRQGNTDFRIKVGRFYSDAETAVSDMKAEWLSLEKQGVVYAQLQCILVESAAGAIHASDESRRAA